MEKTRFTTSDVLEQLFDDDSDFSGSDSEGEGGEDVYACGPPVSASILREEENLDDIFQVSGFYSESASYLLLARQN